MYFSMIKLRRDISASDIFAMTEGDGYQAHQLVWNLFADHPDRRRDFIYRYERVGKRPTFYTVSKRMPQDSADLWEVVTKEYHPELRAGQRLGFTLCANPIRSKRDQSGRQHRHDVIMEAKLKQKGRGAAINLPALVQEHGGRWLIERTTSYGFGALLDEIRVDAYHQHRLFTRKSNKPITFSTIEVNGILTVIEPGVFVEKCLFAGIGPAKGFGCGLMLVRRILRN